jgi:hypothetical protein
MHRSASGRTILGLVGYRIIKVGLLDLKDIKRYLLAPRETFYSN